MENVLKYYYQFSCSYFRLNAKGGKTLSLLHEKCVTQSLASTDKLRELGLSLTRSAAEAYFEVILYIMNWLEWLLFRYCYIGIIEHTAGKNTVEKKILIGVVAFS